MNIPIDKKAHFLAGAAIASTVALYAGLEVGLIACLVIGVGKEVYDKASGKGTPDIWDAVATMLGSIVLLPYYLT